MLSKILIWPKICSMDRLLSTSPPHLRCPFCFLFLAGVLIGWLAAPFSSATGTGAAGGEVGEKGSISLSMLDLKGPAGENFRGLRKHKMIHHFYASLGFLSDWCKTFRECWKQQGNCKIISLFSENNLNVYQGIQKSKCLLWCDLIDVFSVTWWVCVGCCCAGVQGVFGVQTRSLLLDSLGPMEPRR